MYDMAWKCTPNIAETTAKRNALKIIDNKNDTTENQFVFDASNNW